MSRGDKAVYKGLTKAQLSCFFREFADKFDGVSGKTSDKTEAVSEKIADAPETVSGGTTDAAENISEKTAEVAEEVSEKTAEAAAEVSTGTADVSDVRCQMSGTEIKDTSEKTADAVEDVYGKIAEKTAEVSAETAEVSEENIVIPDFDPENFQKLEMGIKKEEEGFSLKVKMKISQPSKEEAEISPESGKKEKSRYKKTKKQMKASFKEISESLENNSLPDEAVVASFLQDSRLMTSFSEYGAEFFPEYDKACAEFRKAFENRDMEACKAAYSELGRLKKDCHKRYKEE